MAPLNSSIDRLSVTFEKCLHRTVRQIANPSGNTDPLGSPPRFVSEKNTLHSAEYDHIRPYVFFHMRPLFSSKLSHRCLQDNSHLAVVAYELIVLLFGKPSNAQSTRFVQLGLPHLLSTDKQIRRHIDSRLHGGT